jgi:nucleoside-diphosphate-sugar epimerase
MMRILVLGGNVFLGRQVAEQALDHGDAVTCMARGASGAFPAGVRQVEADRSQPGAYETVRSGDWDAVIDVAWQPGWVRSALAALAERTRHWTYVSSCSVYAGQTDPGADESAPLLDPLPGDRATREQYGAAKAACEQACAAALGDRLHISRAGLLAGPGDLSDRVGYWPGRFARGGDVLVPGDDGPAQVLDVRDLASYLLLVAGLGTPLLANAVGAATTLHAVLTAAEQVASEEAAAGATAVGEAAGGAGDAGNAAVTRVEPDDAWLLEQGVEPYMGPESLPLWLPLPDWAGFSARDDTRAVDAGLARRPPAETLAAALADERRLGLDRPRQAGLTPGRERQLVAAWRAR